MAKSCPHIYRLCNTQYNLLIVFTNSQPKQAKRESHSLDVNGHQAYSFYRTMNAKSHFNNDKYIKSLQNARNFFFTLQPDAYKIDINIVVLVAPYCKPA